MNLDDLEKVAIKVVDKVKEEEPKTEEKDDDYDEDDSTEADLSTALYLLEDCYQIFDDLLKGQSRGKVRLTVYLQTRVQDVAQDVLTLTSQYDTPPKPKSLSEAVLEHINSRNINGIEYQD